MNTTMHSLSNAKIREEESLKQQIRFFRHCYDNEKKPYKKYRYVWLVNLYAKMLKNLKEE